MDTEIDMSNWSCFNQRLKADEKTTTALLALHDRNGRTYSRPLSHKKKKSIKMGYGISEIRGMVPMGDMQNFNAKQMLQNPQFIEYVEKKFGKDTAKNAKAVLGDEKVMKLITEFINPANIGNLINLSLPSKYQ